MDILTCLTAVASCITAIATAVTVLVAIKQFKKTLLESERQRKEDRVMYLKDNASLVDIWIALKKDAESKQHFIVIQNDSDSSVRNLEINCVWKNRETDCDVSHIKLDFLPKGIWCISRNYKDAYDWEFPISISANKLSEEYEPRFRACEDHKICSYTFYDAHENRWKRDCDSRMIWLID